MPPNLYKTEGLEDYGLDNVDFDLDLDLVDLPYDGEEEDDLAVIPPSIQDLQLEMRMREQMIRYERNKLAQRQSSTGGVPVAEEAIGKPEDSGASCSSQVEQGEGLSEENGVQPWEQSQELQVLPESDGEEDTAPRPSKKQKTSNYVEKKKRACKGTTKKSN